VDKKTRSSALLAILWGVGAAVIAVVLFALGGSAGRDVDLQASANRVGVAGVVLAAIGVVGGAAILARKRYLPVLGVLVACLAIGVAEFLLLTGVFAYPGLLGPALPLVFVGVMVWASAARRTDRETQRESQR
jgi:hypothetical protein